MGGSPKPPDCVVSSFLAITAMGRSKPPRPVCRGAKPLECVPRLQMVSRKRVQGLVPAEGLGVSPNPPFLSPKNGGQGVESTPSARSQRKPTDV